MVFYREDFINIHPISQCTRLTISPVSSERTSLAISISEIGFPFLRPPWRTLTCVRLSAWSLMSWMLYAQYRCTFKKEARGNRSRTCQCSNLKRNNALQPKETVRSKASDSLSSVSIPSKVNGMPPPSWLKWMV